MSEFNVLKRNLPIPFNIEFDSTGGSQCQSITVNVGESYGELPEPTRQHYKFTGWHLDSSSGELVTSSTIVDYCKRMLYASWDAALEINWDGTTNGGSAVTTTNEYFVGDPFGELPASPTKAGYTFIGWFMTATGKTFITEQTIVDSSHTHLYARYMDFQNSTQFQIQPTSTSYRKAGIYSATRRSSSDVIAVDWGDGKTTCVDGSISQIVHEYASTGTYTVKVSDNISDMRISYSNSTWYQTTTSLRYNFKKMLAWSTNVTTLLDRAFYYCYNMNQFVFPTGITSIPTYLFYYCYNLQSINIPSTVTSFQNYAFQGCYNLKSVIIPTGVSNLASYTFAGCYNLTSITCQRTTAPTANYGTFGYSTYSPYYYVGYGTRSTGNNTLNILPAATGYDTGYWSSPLRNASYCGFNVKYIGDPCYVTFDATPGCFEEGISGNIRYVKLIIDEMQSGTGGEYIQISKFELVKNDGTMYDWPSSTQISYPSTLSPAGDQTADKMLDHSTSTKFCAYQNSTSKPYDIIFDVGDAYAFDASSISCWQWWTAGDSATFYGRNIKSFKLQFSIDGSNYVTVDDVKNCAVPSQNDVLAYQGDVLTAQQTTKIIEYIQGNVYGSLPSPIAPLSTPYLSGWYDDPISGNKITKNSIVPATSSLTLYALYSEEESLPYDSEVEWLQSTGTQYIDTGIQANQTYGVEFEFMFNSSYTHTEWSSVFSGYLDNFTLGFQSYDSDYYYIRYRGTDIGRPYVPSDTWQTFKVSTNGLVTLNNFSSNRSLPIGTTADTLIICDNSQHSRPSPIKFRKLKIYDASGNLVRDLIPVRVGNVGCMYDKVLGEIFENKGSGNFIGGPVINPSQIISFASPGVNELDRFYCTIDSMTLPQKSFTLWAKLDGSIVSPNEKHALFKLGGWNSGIGLMMTDASTSNCDVLFEVYAWGTNITVANPTNWHHYAVVFGTSSIKLYVDGELKTTMSNSYITPQSDFGICGYGKPSSEYGQSYKRTMNGKVCRMAIFNKELSQAEVAADMQLQSQSPNPSDLLHLWTSSINDDIGNWNLTMGGNAYISNETPWS